MHTTQSLSRVGLGGIQTNQSFFLDMSNSGALSILNQNLSYNNLELNLSSQKQGASSETSKLNISSAHKKTNQHSSAKTQSRVNFGGVGVVAELISGKSKEVSPEVDRNKTIEELLKSISKTALQMSKKREVDDLSLMDLLNGFDLVVAERRPRTDIANQVYRMILRQEREKQYSSIQDLSTEIKALKQYERQEEEVKRSLQEVDQNILNTTQFDFQGSFGGEDEGASIFERRGNKENIKHKLKQKHNFPKFSMDNVLELQKLESFQQRCNKLSQIERQMKPKHKFRQNESVQRITDTPNFLNRDLEVVSSIRSPLKNISKIPTREQPSQQHRLNLPKLNFSGLLNQSPSTGHNKRSHSVVPDKFSSAQNFYLGMPQLTSSLYQERAIDSDRNIAFAYYARRLLLTAWRSLYNYHLDASNKTLYKQLATQKHSKNAKRRIFRALHQQSKQHYGHGRDNKRAFAYFQLRVAVRYLRRWRQEAHERVIEKTKLEILQEHLKNVKRRQYFEKLKKAVFKLQMRCVQVKTAEHVNRQRRLRKALIGLKYLVAFRKHQKRLHLKTRKENRLRLLRKGLRGLELNRLGTQRYKETLQMSAQVRRFNLLKLSMKNFKEFNLKRLQYKSLHQHADNYHRLCKLKQSFECLHKYCQLMKGVNKQLFYIDTYYQKKLKFNLFQFLLASNMVFIEKEENLVMMKQRLRMRKIFTALAQNRKNSRVHRVPKQHSYFYAGYLWLQVSFDKLVDPCEQIEKTKVAYNQFLRQSKVSYYKKLHQNGQKQLKAYFIAKIFNAWKLNTLKLRSFVQSREGKLKFKIMRTLRLRGRTTGKYKYLLSQNLKMKALSRTTNVFEALSKYANRKRMARLIVQKMDQVRVERTLEKVFKGFKLFAKRVVYGKNQKAIAEELHLQNAISKPFRLWRSKFLKLTLRADLKQRYQEFNRQTLLKKYFGQMIFEFSKLSLKYQKQLAFHSNQRRKALKKAMCGFLQNILLHHEQRSKLQIALGYLKNNLMVKAIKAWQYLMPEMKQKSSLYRLLSRDREQKTTVRCFNALKMYKSFKLNRKTVDYLMTRSLQMITQKRFFSSWRTSLNQQTSLKILSSLFTGHRLREFYSRTQKKIVFEDSAVSHMQLFREFKLLEFSMMRGLKRNVDRRYGWLAIWDKVQENKDRFSKLHCLRAWRGEKLKIDKERKTVQFTLIQIKNQIAKKYFKVLKDRMILRTLLKQQLASKKKQARSLYFKTLKRFAKSRVNCRQQLKALAYKKRREIHARVMDVWINEIEELRLLRNIFQQKALRMRYSVLHSWRQKVQANKTNRIKILTGFQISNFHRARLYLRLLYESKEKSMLQRQRYHALQVYQQQNLLRSVLNEVRHHLQHNRDAIKKMQLIKRRVQARVMRLRISQWQKQCSDTLTKLRVLKCLGALNRNIQLRGYLYDWLDFTQESQEIEERGEYQFQLKQQQQKQDALRTLKQHQERKVIERQRLMTIKDYLRKKTQLKFLTYLRYAVRILDNRKENKTQAFRFCRSQLLKKALVSFAYQASKHAHFRQLTQQFQSSIRNLKAPALFQNLRAFTYHSKEERIKEQFGYAFMSNRLSTRCFKALLMNYLLKRDQRNKGNQALVMRCKTLMKQAYDELKLFTVRRKIQQERRQYLGQTIASADQGALMRTAFESLKEQFELNRDITVQSRGQIALNLMKRVFGKLKDLASRKRNLKQQGKQVSVQRKKKQQRTMMHKWMRALGNESKVKVMHRNRATVSKLKAFGGLKRMFKIRRFAFLYLNSKAQAYLKAAVQGLYCYSQKQQHLRRAQSHLIYQNMQRTLARSFLGLRYQTLVMKNQKVLQLKKNRTLAIKSFSGWKYSVILDKTFRTYSTLKYNQELSLHFTNWFNLYKCNTTQRGLLGSLITKKDSLEKKEYFTKWRRQAFKGRFLDLLQVNFTFPHQRLIASRCLENWRRFARLNSQKQELTQKCEDMRSSLLARRVLREWYTAVKPNLPARVFGHRLESAVNRLLKVKALYLISVQGYRNTYIEENLTELTQRKGFDIKRDYFNVWRRQFAILNLQRIVQVKNKRKMLRNCVEAMKLHTQESQLEKQQFNSLGDFIKQVSPHTQISLMRVFAGKASRLQPDELLRQYFMRLKLGVKNLKKLNGLNKLSLAYRQQKAYQKYFYKMLETFYLQYEDKAQQEQGRGFWRSQILKKTLWAFVENTLSRRKIHHARAYYEHKLGQQAMLGLKGEVHKTKQKSQLNTRMMYFLKKKCIMIFKVAFTQWRVKFEHRHYGKTAVSEYNSFRNTKLKRMAFDYFVAIVQQKLQIKDMVAKAQNYFLKKDYLKTLHKYFFALRDFSLTNKHDKEKHSESEMTALKFYAFNLMNSHLRAWKREVRVTRNRQKRSKMYSLFSAWKFYTKERVLLKKYLQECSQTALDPRKAPRNGSKGSSGSNRQRTNSKELTQNENIYVNQDGYLSARSQYNSRKTNIQRLDPNLMTTQEMRDNVARYSNIKSDFYDGLSQEGTPFVTALDRKILGSNNLIVNSASPSPIGRVANSGSQVRKVDKSAEALSRGFNLGSANRMSIGTINSYAGFQHSSMNENGNSNYMNQQHQPAAGFGLGSQADVVNFGGTEGGVGSNYNSANQSVSSKSPLHQRRVAGAVNDNAYSSGGNRPIARKYA